MLSRDIYFFEERKALRIERGVMGRDKIFVNLLLTSNADDHQDGIDLMEQIQRDFGVQFRNRVTGN